MTGYEKISCFEAEVVLDGEQSLGETEDIKVKVVALEDLDDVQNVYTSADLSVLDE